MELRNYKESDLAEKIKKEEKNVESLIDINKPIFVRLDGKRFSKFTKGFDYPFDDVFRTAMKKTMLELCSEIQGAVMEYTQSDEITILFEKTNSESQIMFGGRVQKIVSELASTATLAFNKYLMEEGEKSPKKDFYRTKYMQARFDCRIFNVDENPEEVFIWRCLDCQKNAIQMISRSYFSHKELESKNLGEMKQMLLSKGVIINDENPNYLYGICAVKEDTILNKGTDRECLRKKFIFKNAKDVLENYEKY